MCTCYTVYSLVENHVVNSSNSTREIALTTGIIQSSLLVVLMVKAKAQRKSRVHIGKRDKGGKIVRHVAGIRKDILLYRSVLYIDVRMCSGEEEIKPGWARESMDTRRSMHRAVAPCACWQSFVSRQRATTLMPFLTLSLSLFLCCDAYSSYMPRAFFFLPRESLYTRVKANAIHVLQVRSLREADEEFYKEFRDEIFCARIAKRLIAGSRRHDDRNFSVRNISICTICTICNRYILCLHFDEKEKKNHVAR